MARTIMSGGGYNSRNVNHGYEPKTEPKTHRGNVAGVAQQGMSTHFRKEPITQGKGYEPKAMPASGVPGYYNAAKEGPGSGRTIYKSGGQHQYGSPAPNAVNKAPDPSATGTIGRDILRDYGPERGR